MAACNRKKLSQKRAPQNHKNRIRVRVKKTKNKSQNREVE